MTEDISGLIAQYLDEELDASGVDAVESAIARDDSTAEALADYRRIRNSLTELKPVEPSAGFASDVMASIDDEPERVIPFTARPRFFIPAAAAAILLLALCLQPYLRGAVDHPGDAPVQVLSLVNVEGDLHANDGNVAREGDIFYSGDSLSTANDGFARIEVTGGGKALLGPKTRLTLSSDDGEGAIRFEDGLLLVSGCGLIKAGGAMIGGGNAEFGVVGLENRAPRLVVEKGEAVVNWDNGRSVSVPAGMEYALIDGGEDVPITSATGDRGERLARLLALKTYASCGMLGEGAAPVDRVLFNLKPSSVSHRTGPSNGGGDNASVSYGGVGSQGGGLNYRGSGLVDFGEGHARLAVRGPGQELRMIGSEGALYIEGAGGVAPVGFGIAGEHRALLPTLSPGGLDAPGIGLTASDSGGWNTLMGGIASELAALLSSADSTFELTGFHRDDSSASFRAAHAGGARLEVTLDRADYLPRSIRGFEAGRHVSTLTLDYSLAGDLPLELDFTPLDSAIPADVDPDEFHALLKQTYGEIPIRIDLGDATDTTKE